MRMLAAVALTALALPAQTQRPVEQFPTSAGPVRITPIRHASVLVEAGGQALYVDPSQGNYDGLPQADFILITDIHGDHMTPATIAKIRKQGTVIVAPEAVRKTVTEARPVKEGEPVTVGKWTVEAVPAYNLKRGPAEGKVFHDKGRGVGYVLTFGGKRFYFAGDTEGTPEMRALKNIDVAFVPMNLPYTMTPEEAAAAVGEFKPKVAIPYHYRGSDTKAFAKALEGSGVEVRLRDWYY